MKAKLGLLLMLKIKMISRIDWINCRALIEHNHSSIY
jgi:hypothetical protein